MSSNNMQQNMNEALFLAGLKRRLKSPIKKTTHLGSARMEPAAALGQWAVAKCHVLRVPVNLKHL